MTDVLDRRRCGVLLHPTSLPGPGATGTLGAEARRFIDFLQEGGFTVWQTLPVGPVDDFGSPYCQRSVYAGDERLIDVEALKSLDSLPSTMSFDAVIERPAEAYRSFNADANDSQKKSFGDFTTRHRRWVFAWGLFLMCGARFDGPGWWQWPDEYRDRIWESLVKLVAESRDELQGIVFLQYLFDLQWSQLKQYANDRGIRLFGDLPFYVDHHSVDVWWSRRYFRLDEHGLPEAVAGVPPDYFSEDGQLWGNPLYNWEQMRNDRFEWWRARLVAQFRHFDLLRVDHFRAFESFWEVPNGSKTAREGRWRRGHGDEVLSELRSRFDSLPLVAEDLGIITDEVKAMRDRYSLPGMNVLQFAFDGLQDNPHLPANHRENSVTYTGTHDNDTLRGWYETLDEGTREYVACAIGTKTHDLPGSMIDAAYRSRSRLTIIPMQDLLGLGSEARMNVPGQAEGNWKWRFDWREVDTGLASRCRRLALVNARIAG
jgi:4-alpha-glucanotransferase